MTPNSALAPIIGQGGYVDLLIKAATSPFSLLGAAFGGGEELSYVDFPPGQAVLADTQTNKLETLAKALYERPNVSLEINGSADPAPDRPALAQVKIRRANQIALAQGTHRRRQTRRGARRDQKLEPKLYERLIRKTYKKTFGSSHYIPDVAPATAATGTNGIAGATAGQANNAPPLPQPPSRKTRTTNRNTEPPLLMSAAKPKSFPIPVATPTASQNPGTAPVIPSTADPEIAAMTVQLVKKIQVTDDDLRDLMQARANTVQTYLLGTQKVTADRLFITAPKPIESSSKGAPRANLSLN